MQTVTARFAGWAMLALGAIILVMWTAFLATGVLDDGILTVENNQYLAFHITAESIMGLLLVVAGAAMLRRKRWAVPAAYQGLGMTVYSTINSLAHSVRNEQALTPVLLASLALACALAVILMRTDLNNGKDHVDGTRYARPGIPGSSGSAVAGEGH